MERTDHYERVAEFMRLAKQDVPESPVIPSAAVRQLRAKLILEEAIETVAALGVTVWLDLPGRVLSLNEFFAECDMEACPLEDVEPDEEMQILASIADGCCDLSVVTVGTLVACGISDVGPMYEVDENNLAKFGPGHYVRDDGKLMKPPTHLPPALVQEIMRQRMSRHGKSSRDCEGHGAAG